MHPSLAPGPQFIRQDLSQFFAQVDLKPIDGLRGSRLLITGGTGFVATWLAELVSYLNDVFNFGTEVFLLARNPEAFKERHPHLARQAFIYLIKRDIRDVNELPANIDWLIHAAGTPDARFHASEPVQTISTIVDGCKNVLQLLEQQQQLKMMVNISSGLVNGSQPMDVPQINEQFSGGPPSGSLNHIYVEAKRLSESLCIAYRSQNRLPISIIRPFAFIGPYQSLQSPWAINNFIESAIKKSEIQILGGGETVRSYMYGSDVAWWILNILCRSQPGDVYNVGSSESVSLRQLAQIIAELMNKSLNIRLNCGTSAHLNNSRLVPDTTSALQNLGLKITVDLKTALQRTITWNQLN